MIRNEMYIGNDGGVKKTDDCTAEEVKWKDLSNNYITTRNSIPSL
ncbi:MAG: hypothetical protein U5K00_01175 [Melioribacteraceae bacterium]|nr:hypothetical protein [Melioribacteraceae bacterium]